MDGGGPRQSGDIVSGAPDVERSEDGSSDGLKAQVSVVFPRGIDGFLHCIKVRDLLSLSLSLSLSSGLELILKFVR